MSKLNVFSTDGYSPWRRLSNWPANFRGFFRQFKWAYQRVTRGFSDYDYWDLDTYLTQMLADSIEQLAIHTHGYPGTEEFPTYESWRDYLFDIVNKLRFSLKDDLPNEYEKEFYDTYKDMSFKKVPTNKELDKKFFEKELENDKLQAKARNEALDMIKHVYDHLWD